MEEKLDSNKDKRPRLSNNIDGTDTDINNLSSDEQVIKIVTEISSASQQIKQIEIEKLEKAVKITNLVQKMNLQQIQSTLSMSTLAELKSQLNECRTDFEKQLLNAIEIIAKCIVEEQCEEQQGQFAQNFSESGLCMKIQDCIEVRKPNEDQDIDDDEWIMDETVLQLARTFCFIPNFEDIDDDIAFWSEMIFVHHFDVIFGDIKDQIKEISNTQDNNNNNNKEEEEQNLKQLVEKMSILLISSKYGIKNGNLNHTISENNNLRNRIEYLFHINCPSNLKCSHNISFSESLDAEPLHLLALDALSQFYYEFDEDEIFMIEEDQAVAHLSPIIVQFANQYSFYSNKLMKIEQKLNQSSKIQNPSLQQFVIYFTLLQKLILFKDSYQIEVASQPDLISIIFAFSSFDKMDNEVQFEISKQSIAKIQECCFNIISDIFKYLDEDEIRQFLFEMKFIKQIIITTGIKGGCLESNKFIIQSARDCFNSIVQEKDDYIAFLHQDDDFDFNQIHSDVIEEIEEFGGFEEFDYITSNN